MSFRHRRGKDRVNRTHAITSVAAGGDAVREKFLIEDFARDVEIQIGCAARGRRP